MEARHDYGSRLANGADDGAEPLAPVGPFTGGHGTHLVGLVPDQTCSGCAEAAAAAAAGSVHQVSPATATSLRRTERFTRPLTLPGWLSLSHQDGASQGLTCP